jgi:hypothetical protein
MNITYPQIANAPLKKKTNKNSASILTNDCSLIENILSGLRKEEINPIPPILTETRSNKEEAFFNHEKSQEIKKRKENLTSKINSKSEDLIFEINKTNREIRKNLNFSNKNINAKSIEFQKITVKYRTILTYTFSASFQRNNLINIAEIELDRFMNDKFKTNFIQNLKFLKERNVLGNYLRFNIISTFDEIGEIETNFKKLNAFLSSAKIGFQFLMIKNEFFSNKILILVHKENFLFAEFLGKSEFYILKVDKDLLNKNCFSAYFLKRKKSIGFNENLPAKQTFELMHSKNDCKDNFAKNFSFRRKIKSMKKIKKLFCEIDNCFRNRKLRKIKEREKTDQLAFVTSEHCDGSQFSENFDFIKNSKIINYEKKNNLDNKSFDKLFLNCLSNNENAGKPFNDNSTLKFMETEVDKKAGTNTCKNTDSLIKNNNGENMINYLDNNINNSKIIISLDSFRVINNYRNSFTKNQWINYDNKTNKIEENPDENLNINYILTQ